MGSAIKEKLYQLCREFAKEKVVGIQQAVDSAQESANTEERNTSGDKHDTSRAMMQLEVEQLSKQLAEAEKSLVFLKQFSGTAKTEVIGLGSLVKTDTANYYVAIGAGKLTVDGAMYFAVSTHSPIFEAMKGKRAGDSFELNGKKMVIKEVC